MAVRNDFAPGEVLAAADLNDTFASKAPTDNPRFTSILGVRQTGSTTKEIRIETSGDAGKIAMGDWGTTLLPLHVTGSTFQVFTGEAIEAERFRITHTGRVGIGTVNPGSGRVRILGVGDSGDTFSLSAENVNGLVGLQVLDNTGIFMPGVFDATTASAANVHMTSPGILLRSTSSIRYKTDVETLGNEYADKVLQMRPVWFRSTTEADNEKHPGWSYYGLIAEEVAEIDPRIVFFGEDDNGNPIPESVQYERLVPHLISVVQRQQAQIDALTARLDAAGI